MIASTSKPCEILALISACSFFLMYHVWCLNLARHSGMESQDGSSFPEEPINRYSVQEPSKETDYSQDSESPLVSSDGIRTADFPVVNIPWTPLC